MYDNVFTRRFHYFGRNIKMTFQIYTTRPKKQIDFGFPSTAFSTSSKRFFALVPKRTRYEHEQWADVHTRGGRIEGIA